jgi:hypothetical protein
MKKLLLSAMLVLGGILYFGCNKADNAVDCVGICDRYKSCFDAKYDTAACVERCRTDADAENDYTTKADACSNCITDKSCASATFTCATDCAGIVP